MAILLSISLIVVAYFFGAIPIGYILGRLYGINLLEMGSGRTGGTNVLRALGLFPAALTILGDAFKGIIPTYAAALLAEGDIIPFWVTSLVGVTAVLGHNYSIFLKFRGGAGGVTALGVLAAMSVLTAFVASLVAVIAILLTRYASAATFSGSVAGLIMLISLALLGQRPWGYSLYGVLAVALIAWSLRPNFAAIRAGTERKIGESKR